MCDLQEVKKKYMSMVKSVLSDLGKERRIRQNSLKKQFPLISCRKYVSEYNHHLTVNPYIVAADMVKLKGQWKQSK